MLSLDNVKTSKTEVKSSDSKTSSNQDKPTLSFSELLKGITLKKDTSKSKDEVLDLKETTVNTLKNDDKNFLSEKDTLVSLLKNDNSDKDTPKLENLEFNSKVINSVSDKLTVSEVKNLIYDAKQYLKSKIQETESFKKSETKDLPKTLKGLVSVADKFGVDLSKITIEKIKLQDNKNNKLENTLISSKDFLKKTDTEVKSFGQAKDLPKEVLTQPIFKIINKKQFSTEELIQARDIKDIKNEPKSKKDNVNDTLRLLLSGEKVEKNNTSLNSEISVASAKVILPDMKSETTKGLESLLNIEPSESSNKSETLISTHKSDSLEVKLNEAKQMVKYLSQDVKQAIDDYKSPFTRIKVQLNPQKLGEVDLTVIQRGKNLVVNLSSNNSAINTLAMNVNDLRTQLNNNGINNATLNFNNNSQSEQQNSFGNQQGHQHEQKQAQREYNYFDNEEQNEEILSSLEIVVPNYA